MTIKANSENIIESAGFLSVLAILSILSIYSCFATTELVSAQENRALAPFPHIHSLRKEISKFPAAFEQFFSDRVAFRLPLITAKNLLTYEIFHTSGNPLVAIGQDNWLFYNSYGVTPAQLNSTPLTEAELQVWVTDIEARKSFLAQHGIKYVLVIPPEKGTMYPELMPPGWNRQSGISRLDQLQNYLREHTDVDVVDAKGLLANEKIHGNKTYHSNDTHWNQRSAFLVAQEILKHLTASLPAVTPVPASELLQGHDSFTGDLTKMLGLQKILPDESPSIVVRTAPHAVPVDNNTELATMGSQELPSATQLADSKLPRALVLRDSFCTYLKAPLSEHFRFCEYQWTNNFQPQAILAEHPDVVINEIAERHLYEKFPEHVPVFLSKNISEHPICTFGDKFELIGLTSQKNYKGITVKLLWHNKVPVKLDCTIGLHCLDSNEKMAGGAVYAPDVIQRTIAANSTWVDTVDIPNRELKDATNLGIIISQANHEELSCDVTRGSWNKRYLVSLEDLDSKRVPPVERVAETGASRSL